MIGAVIGLAALPVVHYLTEAGAVGLRSCYALQQPDLRGAGCLAAVVAVIAVLAHGPWLSPLAALVCGLPMAVLGALFAVAPWAATPVVGALPPMESLTGTAEAPGVVAGVTGLSLVVGALLLVSAAFPARWR